MKSMFPRWPHVLSGCGRICHYPLAIKKSTARGDPKEDHTKTAWKIRIPKKRSNSHEHFRCSTKVSRVGIPIAKWQLWKMSHQKYLLSHAIILNAGTGPPTLQWTVIPPWNYAPQLPGKVTPTSSPIVNATLKWKSTKNLSSQRTVGLPTMGPMGLVKSLY